MRNVIYCKLWWHCADKCRSELRKHSCCDVSGSSVVFSYRLHYSVKFRRPCSEYTVYIVKLNEEISIYARSMLVQTSH